MTDLATLESDLTAQIAAASDEAALEAVRVAALGVVRVEERDVGALAAVALDGLCSA